MEIEALSHRLGELRCADVRAALGDAYGTAHQVPVVVLGRPGEVASYGIVSLSWIRAGSSEQRMLVCPTCRRSTRTLFTDGTGGLGCAGCARRRTRHQLEKHRRDFRKLGGREEDLLIRTLRRQGVGAVALHRARKLAEYLIGADLDLVRALRPAVAAALSLSADVDGGERT